MHLLKHVLSTVLAGAALELGRHTMERMLEQRRRQKLRETAMGAKVKNLAHRVDVIERLLSEHEDEGEDEGDELAMSPDDEAEIQ